MYRVALSRSSAVVHEKNSSMMASQSVEKWHLFVSVRRINPGSCSGILKASQVLAFCLET